MAKKKIYEFVAQDIAQAAGVAIGTIYAAISKEQFDPDNLESVVDYVAMRRYEQLRTSPVLDPLQQMRALELATGMGVTLLGECDGTAIVHHSIPPGEVFAPSRLAAEKKLHEHALYGIWNVNGEKVSGWACTQK